MPKPKIAILSGPTATIANSPSLVTSNKGRFLGDRILPGRYDHLVSQLLYEPVTVKIRKFSAHPLEEDAKAIYHGDNKEYYEVELRPEDGPYLLPYMARRIDGSPDGVPFEDNDLLNSLIEFGGRQFFYPDASRIFTDIDRTISGRDEHGEGNSLDNMADYDFIRVLPPAGYIQQGEVSGIAYFPYKPYPIAKRPRYKDLAHVVNSVQSVLNNGQYSGVIWMEGTPTVEETLYWLSLLIDTKLPVAGVASQRPHGQLANDGDRNIVDAVSYVLSGQGQGAGAVGVQDERIFAAREFKKADARPGGYKVTGGHGGILGTVGPPVTLWYRPAYLHTYRSEVNLRKLPEVVKFLDAIGDNDLCQVRVKNSDGTLCGGTIPRVHIVKYGAYMDEDETANPCDDVDIIARIKKGLDEQSTTGLGYVPFHGFILEGTSPFGVGSGSQHGALGIAAYSGMPVVRVGRSDPGGPVDPGRNELTIAGSNLDANKARLLLIAAMLKLGRLPKAKDPRNPDSIERAAVVSKIAKFQAIFDTH